MDIDFKKLAPWNWFKNSSKSSRPPLPCRCSAMTCQRERASQPDPATASGNRPAVRYAFRGFGFPALNMPQWPSDWRAC